jgi:hypothetical protein
LEKRILALLISFISFSLFINNLFADEISSFAYFIPQIDGICDKYCWNDALKIKYDFGYLYFKNDFTKLYILIDVIADSGKDRSPAKPFCEDYFELTVDWDLDGKITKNIDRNYTLMCSDCPDACALVYRYYTGVGFFSDIYYSSGKAMAGFGSTITEEKEHRFYEIAIPLFEIKKESSNNISYGIKIVSLNPELHFESPPHFYIDFTSLKKITLASYVKELNLVYIIGSRVMYVNEKQLEMDIAPFIYNSRTYLPIRYILEPFGAYFEWNSRDLKLVILVSDKIIEMKINDPFAYVNGKRVNIDSTNKNLTPILVPPGRVCIPLRFITNTLGCKTNWNSREQKIKISYKFK